MEALHGKPIFLMQKIDKPNDMKKLRRALLEYCKQDTLAMVMLLEKLEDISQPG